MNIVQMTPLEREGFCSWRVDPAILGGTMDPFLSIDFFEMEKQVFLAHPHAGFCAVTYILSREDETVLV